jgi:hypothetical protein
MAYCLLGIFGIHMPLLYGEGDQAFVRLQEEMMKKSHDDPILAWEFSTTLKLTGGSGYSLSASSPTDILAKSPRNFKNCRGIVLAANTVAPFSMTNLGLQMQLPVVRIVIPLSVGRVREEEEAWVGLLC